jgi:DnaK suppressor protein
MGVEQMPVPEHEVAKARQLLLARQRALLERHERVEADLQRRGEPLAGDWSDRAIQLQNDEALQAIDDAAQEELVAIEESLQRLGRGLYGICKDCGEPIEPARLEALHSVTCASCASD